jgi:hypothetical protein
MILNRGAGPALSEDDKGVPSIAILALPSNLIACEFIALLFMNLAAEES